MRQWQNCGARGYRIRARKSPEPPLILQIAISVNSNVTRHTAVEIPAAGCPCYSGGEPNRQSHTANISRRETKQAYSFPAITASGIAAQHSDAAHR